MERHEGTWSGEGDGLFHTTHWTVILRSRSLDDEQRREALTGLLTFYWKPVYCYLRRKGHGDERAKDLTQGFFQEVVLRRELIPRADPERGRFRTFLLTALDRYLTSIHRAETARKRKPDRDIISLDEMMEADSCEPGREATPEQAFERAWASRLLDTTMKTVEALCRRDGQETSWEVFCARVIRPILDNTPVPTLATLYRTYDIPDEMHASKMILAVKRRFQTVLRCLIRGSVDTDDDVEQEIRDLIRILSGS
jgi:RNA polymerase sigma-70 factor (ECF subfamily)